MDYICIFFGALFIAAGVMFFLGKGHTRLSAWKNMPQEEKEKLRIAPLCRNIGAVIGLSGLIFVTKGLSGKWFVAAMLIWMLIAGLDVWYIEKSGRYRS